MLYAHAAPDREVFPRDAVYAAGATNAEIRSKEVAQLGAAQSDAAAAALRAAGFPVRQVPMVQSVAQTGPAADKLFPGDFVLEIDGVATATTAAVRAQIEKRAIGDPVTFTVQRDLPDGTRGRLSVKIDTTASKTQASLPVWGGNLTMGYSYEPRITFHLDSSLGGPTAGLILALGVYDRITADNVINGRIVSGAGTIDGVGNVAAVGGIKEKLVSAERAGAEVFFVPSGNCADMDGVPLRKNNLTGPIALVLGSEGSGVSQLVKKLCDGVVRLDMAAQGTGVDSYNVSVAAGIILYEIQSQRAAQNA